jgi:YihY family inner membrane protein
VNVIQRTVRRIDAFQQGRRSVAFVFAVVKKFGDDRAGDLAALVAYYGFFSLFPLLLVLVAILGLILRGHPALQQSVLDSTLAQFPVIGDQLRSNIHGLSGAGAGTAVGIGTAGAVWAGMGVMGSTQNAFNQVWDVPRKDRPNFIETRLRGFLMLVGLGVIALGATFVSGIGTGEGGRFLWLGAIALLGTLLMNLLLYMIAFRVLTDLDLSWSDVFPGAAAGAVAWTALQSLGSFYIQHQIKNASDVYGTFALVLGLLTWIYLGAQITLLAAEVNVVRKHHLWPRSIVQEPPLAPADKRVLARGAKVEERIEAEDVSVHFDETSGDDSEEGRSADLPPATAPAGGNGARGNRSETSARRDDGVLAKSAAVGAGLAVLLSLSWRALARTKRGR